MTRSVSVLELTDLLRGLVPMLALAEPYMHDLSTAQSDGDLIVILARLARNFGFDSAFTMEYGDDAMSVLHVLDTDPRRDGWWTDYLKSGLRQAPGQLQVLLTQAPVQRMDASRFSGPNDPLHAFCRRVNMVDMTTVAVTHDGRLIGVGSFCGIVDLDMRHQMALQLIVYALFAKLRKDRKIGIVTASEPLTPREKEVIALSADGLTSSEIAERLGMSARTVNQHVDNVATKLGTRNRAHTVAEAIRHGML